MIKISTLEQSGLIPQSNSQWARCAFYPFFYNLTDCDKHIKVHPFKSTIADKAASAMDNEHEVRKARYNPLNVTNYVIKT